MINELCKFTKNSSEIYEHGNAVQNSTLLLISAEYLSVFFYIHVFIKYFQGLLMVCEEYLNGFIVLNDGVKEFIQINVIEVDTSCKAETNNQPLFSRTPHRCRVNSSRVSRVYTSAGNSYIWELIPRSVELEIAPVRISLHHAGDHYRGKSPILTYLNYIRDNHLEWSLVNW
jgi:hypothetical protein